MPDHSTLQAREVLTPHQVGAGVRPSTLRRLNTQLVRLAQARGVTGGTKMRCDSTVMESNTRSDYPTDSRLLDDSVRVLGRVLARARFATGTGKPGLERWLGWGIITNNLVVTATRLTRRRKSSPVHA